MLLNKGKSPPKKSRQRPISAMYYQRTIIQHPSRIVLFKYNSGHAPAPGSSPTPTRLLGDYNRFNHSSHIFCSNAHEMCSVSHHPLSSASNLSTRMATSNPIVPQSLVPQSFHYHACQCHVQLPFVIFFNATDAVRFLDFIVSIAHSMYHFPASCCALTLQTNEYLSRCMIYYVFKKSHIFCTICRVTCSL